MDAGFDLGMQTGSTEVGVGAGQDEGSMVFNLNEVSESTSFEVLPKGTYPAVVEEFEYTTSQSSGVPMLKAVYSITEGEFAERKVFDYYVLSGEGAKYSLPKLKQLITRVVPEQDLSQFNPSAFAESGIIINRECQLKLTITTQKTGDYKGEKRNQVREILAAATGAGSFLG